MKKECLEKIKEHCEKLEPECLSQMDYYLVGQDCYQEVQAIMQNQGKVKFFDEEYIRIGTMILEDGKWVYNKRTGKRCLTLTPQMAKYNMSDTKQFPLLTTKEMDIRPIAAELIGFIKGHSSAAQFREEGCKIWDANANDNQQWLNNPNRKGQDDLGRIYGVQARDWRGPNGESIDQLAECVSKLKRGEDDRRLIVNHWNPGEIDQMALPPCHVSYYFMILDGYLHMTMIQRSCDYPLGVPYNIASYALLLRVVANMTGLKAGELSHVMHNIHIYEDQLEAFKEQMDRKPKPSPTIIVPTYGSLEEFCDHATKNSFVIENYDHDEAIRFPFSV